MAESNGRYKAPARYDDELSVRTHITELRRRSVRFGYEIVNAADGRIIAEGETGHVVTDPNGRVITMPETYRAALCAAPITPPRVERVPDGTPPE